MSATLDSSFVRNMSEEDKHFVLLELLREALQSHGDTGLLPIDDEHGKSFGYYVPPKAAAEQLRSLLPTLSPEDRKTTAAALSSLDDTFEMDSFLSELSRGDA
jgi:hypothetical protein